MFTSLIIANFHALFCKRSFANGTETNASNATINPIHKIYSGFDAYCKTPAIGFKNINRVEYHGINLDTLQKIAEENKLDRIDIETLIKHGLTAKSDKVKILGRGELKAKLQVEAHAFSASAQKAIEEKGGSISKI